MKQALIVGGLLTVLVGLGFVCPQIQNLRMTGSLAAWQIALLGFGTVMSVTGGIVCGQATRSLLMQKHAP